MAQKWGLSSPYIMEKASVRVGGGKRPWFTDPVNNL